MSIESGWEKLNLEELEKWIIDNSGKIESATFNKILEILKGEDEILKLLAKHNIQNCDFESFTKIIPLLKDKFNQFEILDFWLESHAKAIDLEALIKNILPFWDKKGDKGRVISQWSLAIEKYDGYNIEVNHLKEILTHFNGTIREKILDNLFDDGMQVIVSDDLAGNLGFLKEILSLLNKDNDSDNGLRTYVIEEFFVANNKNINFDIFKEILPLFDSKEEKLRVIHKSIDQLDQPHEKRRFLSKFLSSDLL